MAEIDKVIDAHGGWPGVLLVRSRVGEGFMMIDTYRTKDAILSIYDAMQRAIDTGEPYQTLLDPPPADPHVAHHA